MLHCSLRHHARYATISAAGDPAAFRLAEVPVATLLRGVVDIEEGSGEVIETSAASVTVRGFGFDVDAPGVNVFVFSTTSATTGELVAFPVRGLCTAVEQSGMVDTATVTFTELGPYSAGAQLLARAYVRVGRVVLAVSSLCI
jgi:hypothetical protein